MAELSPQQTSRDYWLAFTRNTSEAEARAAFQARYGHEPPDPVTPEQCFERRWALTLLETVLNRLGAEYERGGKGPLFAALRPCLLGESEAQPYAALAGTLNMNESAVKVAVHRLRKHYRQLLADEVAQTVASPGEVREELKHLLAVLAR